jgi:hypothetical protein
MAAVVAVARQQLRRSWRATVVLLVLAGGAAAISMAVWAAGRRTAGAAEHFVVTANGPDTSVVVCPPGHGPEEAEVDPGPCFTYGAEAEQARLASLPHVEHVGQFAWRNALGGLTPDRDEWVPFGLADLADVPDVPTMIGEPVVVEGRLARDDASDEVMIREPAATSLGVEPGDPIWLTDATAPRAREPIVATVVGVIRTPVDLLPLGLESDTGPVLMARGGWVEAHGDDLTGFHNLAVWLDDGDVAGFQERARQALGDQYGGSEPILPLGEQATVEQATQFESRAAAATAAIGGLATLFFVGQAVSRQTRSESDDGATLLALGLTRRQLATATALRWLPVALGAALVAVLGTVAASRLGPFGVARRGPWDRGLHADWLVLVVGAVAIAVPVLAVATVRGARQTTRRDDGTRRRLAPAPVGSPGLRVGIGLAWRSVGRTALPLLSAIVATGLAVAAVVTAAGGTASLRTVIDDPARFGAPWDAVFESPEAADEVGRRLAEIEGVVGADQIVGADVRIGDDPEVWTQALLPVAGFDPTPPVITDGRAPIADDEIALGALTGSRADVGVGDVVSLDTGNGEEPLRFRVVGTAMITDGYEPNVGDGAYVAPGGLERIDPSADEFAQIAVQVGGPERSAALAELEDAFPGIRIPFPVPLSLANAERISGLPLWLALGAAALAAFTFGHALAVSVRRNRGELAVCRAMGFTRRQLYGAVGTHATLLGLAAAALGLVVGIAGARWGWRLVSAAFGVASGPIVTPWVLVAAALTTLVLANLAAAIPARRAATTPPARTLRAE